MQIMIHVPDDFVEPVKDQLANGSMGMLEAVALDAVLKFLICSRRHLLRAHSNQILAAAPFGVRFLPRRIQQRQSIMYRLQVFDVRLAPEGYPAPYTERVPGGSWVRAIFMRRWRWVEANSPSALRQVQPQAQTVF
jgi:hypothetical protein